MTTRERVPVEALLHGAADLHIHTAPDIFDRNVTATTAAEAARDAGMAAIVVKSHSTDTAARAAEAAERTGFRVFGGVALNHSVGGLNPHAVRESVRRGGRVVWMPTLGAQHFMDNAHHAEMLRPGIPDAPGLTVLDGTGLRPEAVEIIDVAAEHDLVLCSGHLSPAETVVFLTEAHRRGVRRLVVTHPHAPFVGMDGTDMGGLARLGAYMELTPMLSAHERAEIIREVGVEHCFVSTDGGTVLRPPPVTGLRDYLAELRGEGFTDAELHHLAVAVPSHLLGLPGFGDRPAGPEKEETS
jgi:hypothetical protein